MKKRLLKLVAVLAIVAVTALVTWRITILTLHIEVNEDTAYITSFGQTDKFDYVPLRYWRLKPPAVCGYRTDDGS